MTRPTPFTTTGLTRIEHISTRQDAAHLRDEGRKELTNLRALSMAQFEAGTIDELRYNRELDILADRALMLERSAATIAERFPQPLTFILAVPTSIERDQLSARMTMCGMHPVTDNYVRATMVDELFNIAWDENPDVSLLKAEEHANLLDAHWMRLEVHNGAISAWEAQEAQRVADIAAGAPYRDPTPLPPKIISVRDNARVELLLNDLHRQSDRIRQLNADRQDFTRQSQMIMVRMHVVDIVNADNIGALPRDKATAALTTEAGALLREALADEDWHDLVAKVNSLYVVSEEEVGNSDSPLEKQSDQTGSTAPSGASDLSGGSSTISNIEPVPAAESGTIIGKSPTSPSISADAPAPSEESPAIQTVEA